MRSRRDLQLLVGAVGISAAGDFLAFIALSVRVHDTTHSGLAVAALFGALLVPVVALAPLAGGLPPPGGTAHPLPPTPARPAAAAPAPALLGGVRGGLPPA